jgi:ATP/ADP translocase
MSVPATILTTAAPTVLAQARVVGQGGLALWAASAAASSIPPILTTLRGGGGGAAAAAAAKIASPTSKGSKGAVAVQNDRSSKLQLSPQARSVAWMALGMACHYLGYSLARPITVALFTSRATGYPDAPGAFPFAMAFVSPVSLVLLFMYSAVLERHGPRGALSRSTLGCALMIFLSAGGIEVATQTGASLWGVPATKFISGPLFVFRESYVQLLTSQYWSFMASVLTPNQSARWFGPIAGLTSISSIVGGTAVSLLSGRLNLSGTLACTGIALVVSLLATGMAYSIAERHGFSPERHQKEKAAASKKTSGGKGEAAPPGGMLAKATKLFARVPVLRALFLEILASQSLATLLNVCFVGSVGATIPDDTVRAGWVGNFYALINVFSMMLQFGVLPLLMHYIEPKDLWRMTPLVSLAFTTFQAVQRNPSLYVIAASLLVMKVLEYSARRMLDEMVYVPLDFESRFLGKEIIGVFGYRFGKSLISLTLSGLTSLFGQFDLQSLSVLSDVAAVMWAKTAWDLSSQVPTRGEAQASYERRTSAEDPAKAKKGRAKKLKQQ